MTKLVRIPLLLVLLAAAAGAAGLAEAQAPFKIAVFDPQRVSEETAEGQRIQAELGAFQARKQQELISLEAEVQELRKQLTTQALSLSAERRQELERTVQRKILELQSAQEAAQREFQLEIAEAQTRFQEQLLAVIEQVGREEEFTLILDLGAVAWAAENVDITTVVVDRFNAMIKPPPAPGDAGSGAGEN